MCRTAHDRIACCECVMSYGLIEHVSVATIGTIQCATSKDIQVEFNDRSRMTSYAMHAMNVSRVMVSLNVSVRERSKSLSVLLLMIFRLQLTKAVI